MLHENLSWRESVFLTLTYEELTLPDGGTLVKSHLQRFWKRLRKAVYPRSLKYYACGEYGDEHGRPHYHAIVFGLSVEDSPLIESTWGLGNVFPGTVEQNSIRYVTKYIGKKIFGPQAVAHYGGRVPEFQLVSRGIGLEWMRANRELLISDLLVYRGKNFERLPRYYYKKLLDSMDGAEWRAFRARRKAVSRAAEADRNLNILLTDGKLFFDCSEEERDKIYLTMRAESQQMDIHLREQGKIQSLKRRIL